MMMPITTKKPLLIVVTGPTASGKTSLGIALAQHFNTQIISADSRQVFKGMSIGTAQPTPKELQQAPHHFIATHNPDEEFSAGIFALAAKEKLKSIFKDIPVAICVGGSGLYVDALCKGLDNIPEIPVSIRESLNTSLIENGLDPLVIELKEKDPEYALKADLANPQRVIRALEVISATGNTYSSYRIAKPQNLDFNMLSFGLDWDRETLYKRINKRVDTMLENGLVKEVENLKQYENQNSLRTVAYKEILDFFKGIYNLDEATAEIKKNTRRFAKRQLTWFRRDENIIWLKPENATEKAIQICDKYLLKGIS